MIELTKEELDDAEKKQLGQIIESPVFKKLLRIMKVDNLEQLARAATFFGPDKLGKIGEVNSLLTNIEKLDEKMKTYIFMYPENS